MKNQHMITVVFAAFLTILNQANAGEKELRKNEVPKAVLNAFEKSYPNAKDVEFEEEMFEGKASYEVEYKDNGKEYEVMYSADGMLLQKEEEIDVSALPEAVTNAIKKEHPKAKIEEAEKLMKADGTLTGYEVNIKTGEDKFELEVDAAGKILKTEKD
ncbi:PepSY-like domain-containing protein [Methylomicrobium lacus]|uniref:PepSY-like domain-containing protein n=1 Tax=Methylomicrobium lacus TaxID=136992 RepID=UPI0035A8B561